MLSIFSLFHNKGIRFSPRWWWGLPPCTLHPRQYWFPCPLTPQPQHTFALSSTSSSFSPWIIQISFATAYQKHHAFSDDVHLKKDKLFDSIELLIVIDEAHPLPMVFYLDLMIILVILSILWFMLIMSILKRRITMITDMSLRKGILLMRVFQILPIIGSQVYMGPIKLNNDRLSKCPLIQSLVVL